MGLGRRKVIYWTWRPKELLQQRFEITYYELFCSMRFSLHRGSEGYATCCCCTNLLLHIFQSVFIRAFEKHRMKMNVFPDLKKTIMKVLYDKGTNSALIEVSEHSYLWVHFLLHDSQYCTYISFSSLCNRYVPSKLRILFCAAISCSISTPSHLKRLLMLHSSMKLPSLMRRRILMVVCTALC